MKLHCGLLFDCSPVLLVVRWRSCSRIFRQKTVDFADRIAALTEAFPRGYYVLVDQLNRAALSIAANLAEENGRFSKADRKHFFIIARGSV